MQARVFCFFAGGRGILNSNQHVWQWKEEAMLCEIHMRDFRSHFWWDFLAYCTRPISVHLVMACVGCSFDSFWISLLSLKRQQNLMKIMFPGIHFPIWPYPHKIMIFKIFILVNCMGWQVCIFTFTKKHTHFHTCMHAHTIMHETHSYSLLNR